MKMTKLNRRALKIKKIKSLYKKGYTMREIGKLVGYSQAWVSILLLRNKEKTSHED